MSAREIQGNVRDFFQKAGNVSLILLGFVMVFFAANAKHDAQDQGSVLGTDVAHADAPSCIAGDSIAACGVASGGGDSGSGGCSAGCGASADAGGDGGSGSGCGCGCY